MLNETERVSQQPGDNEIWEREDWNNGSKTHAISLYS